MTVTPYLWNDGSELGDTQSEVGTNLAIMLRGWLLDYEFVQVDTYIKNQNHVSRCKSALQKAIRRGNVEVAIRMGQGLHGFDWEIVWRRMAVLALEEIGVADPVLVTVIIWVCGKRVWREENGGCVKYLYMLLTRMCHSVKDRSVCDLACWADWGPDLAEKRQMYFGSKQDMDQFNTLTYTMANPYAYLADRMLAAWALVGTKKARGENVPPDCDGHYNEFMDAWQTQAVVKLPAAVEMMCRMAINKTGDPMPVAYPFIYEMVAKTSGEYGPNDTSIGWEPDELTDLPPFGNFPSETFDQHCREGKKAIRLWNKECEPIADFLQKHCGIADQVDKTAYGFQVTSILVFRVEGSQVDRRLVFDGSKDLFDIAELALNSSQGTPGRMNDYAMELVRLNLPWLHYARRVALDMIPEGVTPDIPVPQWLGELMETKDPIHLSGSDAPGHADLMVAPEEIDQALAEIYGIDMAAPVAKPKKKLVIRSK